MASIPTLKTSGTQVASIGTEHTLYSTTDAGVWVLVVDMGSATDGDFVELRVKTIVLSGGVLQGTYYDYFNAFPVENRNQISVPIPMDAGIQCDFTLKQTAGSGRSFPWKVLAL